MYVPCMYCVLEHIPFMMHNYIHHVHSFFFFFSGIPPGLLVHVPLCGCTCLSCECNDNIGPPPDELQLTCRGGHSQVSCLLVKINSSQHQSHYTHPLQPPALLVQ